MGLLLGKCCWCCFNKSNSVGIEPEKHLKVLLLGIVGSGKTEVGYYLSKRKRLDFESTNGVQFFRMPLPDGNQLSITEIGGNTEMQKLWHHYYLTTMGIIYCFDMSGNYETSFELLVKTLGETFVSGKPVLLVATKSDLVDEAVQLYDIENAFQLDAIANEYATHIRVCYFEGRTDKSGESVHQAKSIAQSANSLDDGINWLTKYLLEDYDLINARIKNDNNLKVWQNQVEKLRAEHKLRRERYQRFPNNRHVKFWNFSNEHYRTDRRIRPKTAPSVIYSISLTSDEQSHENSTSVETVIENIVPNGNVIDNVATLREITTDV